MAEVVGTVAAALQLAEVALKLKKLYSDVRDAPSDLHSLVDEVTVLADVLTDVGHTPQASSSADDRAWRRCHTLLKDSAEMLSKLTAELEAALQSHRRSGAIRLFLKKDELTRCKERLERVKSTMMLAQQAYSSAILTQQNELLLQEIRAVATMQQAQTASSMLIATATTTTTAVCMPVGQVEQSVQPNDRGATNSNLNTRPRTGGRRSRYNLQLPSWILRKGVQILIDRNSHSWGLSFRSYNRLPPGSDLFRAAKEGDWLQVRRLFDDSRASPFDLDPKGQTLLHIATYQVDPSACRFLMSYGLDPLYISGDTEESTIEFLTVQSYWMNLKGFVRLSDRASEQAMLDTFEVLLAHPECFISTEDDLFDVIMAHANSTTLSLIYQTVVPAYEKANPFWRAARAMVVHDPDSIPILLGSDLDLPQALSLLNVTSRFINHRLLLLSASRGLPYCLLWSDAFEPKLKGWKHVLATVIEYESKCQGLLIYSPSMVSFLDIYAFCEFCLSNHPIPADWNEYFTQVGRIWLQFLLEQGADLLRYGNAEKQCLYWNNDIFFEDTTDWPRRFRVQQMTFGPIVDDWRIFVVAIDPVTLQPMEYEMAWEFWQWIENPELFEIPGCYPPVDEDDSPHLRRRDMSLLVEAPAF